MRGMQDATGEQTCAFGCTAGRDRIEHYAVCPKVWNWFQKQRPQGLGISERWQSLQSFLIASADMDQEVQTAMAIAVYAVSNHGMT